MEMRWVEDALIHIWFISILRMIFWEGNFGNFLTDFCLKWVIEIVNYWCQKMIDVGNLQTCLLMQKWTIFWCKSEIFNCKLWWNSCQNLNYLLIKNSKIVINYSKSSDANTVLQKNALKPPINSNPISPTLNDP